MRRIRAEVSHKFLGDILLCEGEVATILDVSMSLLRKWRRNKQGPPWVMLGIKGRSLVRYKLTEIRSFIEAGENISWKDRIRLTDVDI